MGPCRRPGVGRVRRRRGPQVALRHAGPRQAPHPPLGPRDLPRPVGADAVAGSVAGHPRQPRPLPLPDRALLTAGGGVRRRRPRGAALARHRPQYQRPARRAARRLARRGAPRAPAATARRRDVRPALRRPAVGRFGAGSGQPHELPVPRGRRHAPGADPWRREADTRRRGAHHPGAQHPGAAPLHRRAVDGGRPRARARPGRNPPMAAGRRPGSDRRVPRPRRGCGQPTRDRSGRGPAAGGGRLPARRQPGDPCDAAARRAREPRPRALPRRGRADHRPDCVHRREHRGRGHRSRTDPPVGAVGRRAGARSPRAHRTGHGGGHRRRRRHRGRHRRERRARLAGRRAGRAGSPGTAGQADRARAFSQRPVAGRRAAGPGRVRQGCARGRRPHRRGARPPPPGRPARLDGGAPQRGRGRRPERGRHLATAAALDGGDAGRVAREPRWIAQLRRRRTTPDGSHLAWTNGDTQIPVWRTDHPADYERPDLAAEAPGRSPEALAVAPGAELVAVADSGAITVSRTRAPTAATGERRP